MTQDECTIESINRSREEIKSLLQNPHRNKRLLVMIGPCSIHDPVAALEYAKRLATIRERYNQELLLVMRVYVEKPRTTVGWKGFIHDPNLNDTADMTKGLYLSRQLMIQVAKMGIPVVTEILSPLVAPFLEDTLSCGVIGARTTESQTHRELVSDVNVPVGFKNGTDGSVGLAVDAMRAAKQSHTVLSVNDDGQLITKLSPGNQDTFVILRGGKSGPNFSSKHVEEAAHAMEAVGLPVRLMVDCSHGNSQKDYRNQQKVATAVAEQFATGAPVAGVMIESNINAGICSKLLCFEYKPADKFPGRQDIDLDNIAALKYGVSVTDGCVGWEETETILEKLATSVQKRQHNVTLSAVAVMEAGRHATGVKPRRTSFARAVMTA